MASMAADFSPGNQRRATPRRHRGWVLVLAAALVLGGCLSTRFIYNQVDWLLVWYLSDVFSLEKEQKKDLRLLVNSNLDFVRTQQLPEYARLLRDLEAGASSGSLSVEQLRGSYDEMIGLFDVFLRQLIPDMAGFLGALNDEQVEKFVAKSDEKNDELWDEYGGETADVRLERRVKSAIKNIQRFTGKLDEQQQVLVEGHIGRLYDNSNEWIEGRRQWQADFQALVLERPPRVEFERRLEKIILDPNYVDSDTYRQQVEANIDIVFAMLVDLTTTLSDKQRERMSERLLGFAEDFEALAEDAKLNQKMAEREAA
jgi:hypothetical protein